MSARRTSLLAAATVALLGSVLVAPAGAQAEPDVVPPAPADPSLPEEPTPSAEDELDDVREVFDGETPAASEAAGEGVEATLELRDLSLVVDELEGDDRREAEGYLARPTDPSPDGENAWYTVDEAPPACYGAICVHYVTSTDDAPSPTNSDVLSPHPDYVDEVLDAAVKVRLAYLAAGYRPVKSDGLRGGGGAGRVDIYIADIGDDGLYGYCPSDQRIPERGPYDAWAYCVVDDDYAASQFPSNTPLENLKVTMAHEYFHAVQFAYDYTEDRWFLEATAAWVEDELYDAIDDNVQYLDRSPLRLPRKPLDTFQYNGGFHYGTWIFFRYLTERYGASQGGLPTVILDMFRRVDGARGGPDQYSIQAVKSVLKARGVGFANTFAKFSAANRRPAATYAEGRVNRYRPAPLFGQAKLGRGQARTGAVTLDHLTSATYRFTPGASVKGNAKLRMQVQMAPARRGSAAVATIWMRSGKVRAVPLRIKASGAGVKALPFAAGKVSHIELTLANAGTKYTCFIGGPSSCQGYSKDNNVKESYRVSVVGG